MPGWPSRSASTSRGAALSVTTGPASSSVISRKTLPRTLKTSCSGPNGKTCSVPGSSSARCPAVSYGVLPSTAVPSCSCCAVRFHGLAVLHGSARHQRPRAIMPARCGQHLIPAEEPGDGRPSRHGAGDGKGREAVPASRPSMSVPHPRVRSASLAVRPCHRTGRPVIWRPMMSFWISLAPSKIVKIVASRCQRSTGYSRVYPLPPRMRTAFWVTNVAVSLA